MTASDKESLLQRLVVGALVAVTAVVGLGWVVTTGLTRLEYQKLPPLKDTESDITFLTADSIRLAELLRRDPYNGVIRKRLATVKARLGLYQEALADLERAVQTNNTPDVFFFRADMFEKLGNLARAQEEMRKAIALNPAHPLYNAAYLRLLGLALKSASASEKPAILKLIADASRNWYVRAPRDKNSYLFLANHYVGPPLYSLQAYRLFLMGLSQSPYMNLNPDYMVDSRGAFGTVDDILPGWAKPYRDLPFGKERSWQ